MRMKSPEEEIKTFTSLKKKRKEEESNTAIFNVPKIVPQTFKLGRNFAKPLSKNKNKNIRLQESSAESADSSKSSSAERTPVKFQSPRELELDFLDEEEIKVSPLKVKKHKVTYNANIQVPTRDELIELRKFMKEQHHKKDFKAICDDFIMMRKERIEFYKGIRDT